MSLPTQAGPHPPLSREMLFYVTDLVPLCSTLLTLKLSGFGDAFGPFVAEELARGLGRTNKVLTTLELAYNAIGDRGAEGLALALGQNRTLTLLLTLQPHTNLNSLPICMSAHYCGCPNRLFI